MASVTFAVGTTSTSNTTSYASSSFTPAAGDLLVVFVHASGTVGKGQLIDSQNLGFTEVASVLDASSANTLYCFVALSPAAASAMTVTFKCIDDAATGADIDVYRVSGMHYVGQQAVRQTANQANHASGSAPAPAFGSAALTGNVTLGAVANSTSPATMTPPTGWTEGNDSGYSTPTTGLETVWRNSGFTGTTVTWGSSSASAFASLIVELDTSTPGSGVGYLVQQARGNNTSTTDLALTLPVAATNGNTIVVAINGNNNPAVVTGVTDSAGNTYNKITAASGATGGTHNSTLLVYYAYNIAGSPTSVTVQKGGGSAAIEVLVREYAGLTTSDPLDTSTSSASSGTSVSTGTTATLSQAAELVVAFEADDAGTSQVASVGSGYGNLDFVTAAAGQIAVEDKVVNATTAVSGAFTLFTSTDNIGSIATFKIQTGTVTTKTQSAKARVANNVTKTQTAKARIANNKTKTQTATAHIKSAVTKTQTTKARIQNIRTKTQAAIAYVSQKMALLQDPFNQNTLNSAKWVQTTLGSATISYDATGATISYPSSSTSSTDGDLTSAHIYDLTGSMAYVHVLAVPSAATSADAELRLEIDGSNYLRWVYEAGTLYAQYNVAGSKTTLFSVAYSSSTHAYWRIREASGTIFWDTSTDGITWTNRASVANPIAVLRLLAVIAATCFQNETNPGTFKVNDFNCFAASATQSAKARIANNFTKTQSTKARVANNVTKTQAAKARIANTLTKTQTGKARIANVKTKTQTAIAHIKAAVTKTQQAKARIANIVTKTQSAKADIKTTVVKTQSTKARISNTFTKTQAAKARIDNPEVKTQSAKARISNTRTKTQSAKARIQRILTKTQSATARIDNPETKTQSAKARIANTLTRTQQAKANIVTQNINSKTQAAKARVANTPTKTQTGKARIQKILTKTQTAIARVANTFTKQQTAKARIDNPEVKTQPAKARISQTLTKLQHALARIDEGFTKTQTARARIIAVQTKTQPAKSRITEVLTLTQPANARVVQSANTTTPIILGQAASTPNIFSGTPGAIALGEALDNDVLALGSNAQPAALIEGADILILE